MPERLDFCHQMVRVDRRHADRFLSKYASVARGDASAEELRAAICAIELENDQDRTEVTAQHWNAMSQPLGLAEAHAKHLADDEQAAALEFLRLRPDSLSRRKLYELRKSLRRMTRLGELNAPAFILGNESLIAAKCLSPLEPLATPPDAEVGSLLFVGLKSCFAFTTDNDWPGRNIGVGTTASFRSVIDETGELAALLQNRPVRAGLEDVSKRFGAYPWIPQKRVHNEGAGCAIPNHFETTGPLGYASDSDLSSLANAMRDLAKKHGCIAFEACAQRLEETAMRDMGIVACIEHLTPEAEGFVILAEDEPALWPLPA